MKKFLPVVLLLATLFLPFSSSATSTLPKVAESVRPLQYNGTLETGETFRVNMCTVTSIDAKVNLWLTAAHCVVNETTQQFEGKYSISKHEALPVKIDTAADLAILKTITLSIPALRIAKTAPTYGDNISVWGHPFGVDEIVYSRGYIAAPFITLGGRQLLLFGTTVAPGNSGSAILNHKNEIVSVVQAVYAYFPGFEPAGGGVKFDVLKGFLVGIVR